MDASKPTSQDELDAKIEDDRRAQQAQADYNAKRVKELEGRLRIWRDDYAKDGDMTIAIPRYQLVDLIGEKPANT